MSELNALNNQRTRVTSLERSKPGTLKLALAYFNLADLLEDREEWNEARLHLEKALTIYERKERKRSVMLAQTYRSLACALSNLNERKTARKYALKAVKVFEQKKPMSFDLACCYDILVGASLEEEKFDEVCSYQASALEVYQRNFPLSLDTAMRYFYLGAMHILRGGRLEAQECFEKALELQDSWSLELATTYSDLAQFGLGDEKQVQKRYESASRIMLFLREPTLPDWGTVYSNLANYCRSRGNSERSRELYVKALKVAEDQGGFCMESALMLGLLSEDDGDLNGALQWHLKAIHAYEEDDDEEECSGFDAVFIVDYLAANAYFGAGQTLDGLGEYLESVVYYQRVVDTCKKLGPWRLEWCCRWYRLPLPSTGVIEQKVACNPSRLLCVGNELKTHHSMVQCLGQNAKRFSRSLLYFAGAT